MKRTAILICCALAAAACSTPQTAERPGFKAEKPAWFEKTIVPQGAEILAVGHSGPQADEQKAKDEALANATKEFARYCKADVDSLDRIYETYSRENAKTNETLSVENRNQVRVKAFVKRAVPDDWYVRREKKNWLASVLLKVPKEEFDRISTEKNVKLSLDIGFYFEDADKKMQPLGDGSVLRSGDGYAVYAKPSDTCFLYVYQVDALNKSFRLFPNPQFKTAENPVPAASVLWVPNDKEVLFLDETTGKESFYIFASPERIPVFEGEKGVNLTRGDMDLLGKKMGAAGVRRKLDTSTVAPPAKSDVVEVKKKLQAEGAFVYETWFWHK